MSGLFRHKVKPISLGDLEERRRTQAQALNTLADQRDIDIRIARLEGAVRVITARVGKLD